MENLFFKRGHQYWKRNAKGQILLINTQVDNHAYDGDAHVFLNPNQFNQDNGTEITQEQFDTVRRAHVARLMEF